MLLTRYTCDGMGMFHAIGTLVVNKDMSVADEQDVFDAEEYFSIHLEVPDIFPTSGKTKSYFTEEGLRAFEEQIDTITYYLDMYLAPISVEKKEYDGVVLYEDPYQVVLAA